MDEDIQQYIYDHIPVVKRNLFTAVYDQFPYVRSGGKFADHINHRNSVFGGSLSTALILASWGTVRALLHSSGFPEGIIVIQTQTVSYAEPVMKDFYAQVKPLSADKIEKFIKMLQKFGKSRLKIEAVVCHEGDTVPLASFTGDFVVVKK